MADLPARITRLTGRAVIDTRPLSGGCVGLVLLVRLVCP